MGREKSYAVYSGAQVDIRHCNALITTRLTRHAISRSGRTFGKILQASAMMHDKISRSAVIGAMGTGLAAAAFPRIATAQTTTVRVAGVFSDLFAEPFYVKDAGAFAKAGFSVEPTSQYNAGAVAAAIGGGALEMGTGDLVSGVNAINAGVPIVLIAGGGLYREPMDSSSAIIAVVADSPIHGPKDLVGKTIGVPTLVGMTTACTKAWLTSHGVTESSVRFVEMPPTVAIPALQRGTVDAALLSEPFVTFGKGMIKSAGSPYDAAADLAKAKQFCVSVWYASKPWIEADPARARRAVEAIYETARWANTHHDETFGILVRDGKLDPEKAHGMQRTMYATSLTPEIVQPALEVAAQNKMFTKAVDARTLITKI
jgi:NitT/TauT family transport system substrate-binding protein